LHAIVCIKQVPDTEAPVKVDTARGELLLAGMPTMVNVFDEYAIEEALLAREKFGGKVTALSMGPAEATEALKKALAMGVDEAILLSDPQFEGADAWSTAYTLAQAIRKIGDFDLVFFGKQSTDGTTGLVAPAVARFLGIPALTFVFKVRSLDPVGRKIVVERLLEGRREVVESSLPAAVSVVKDINQPRYPTLLGIRKASKMPVPVWTAADLVAAGANPAGFGLQGSPSRVLRVEYPPARAGKVELIGGATPEEQAAALADRLLGLKIL
jgi:electron transfer flavoprotein beta subunit